jgi:predicted metal-dependent hydrolase
LQRLATDFCRVDPGLWLWGVLDLAEHAAIALTATAGFAGSVLSFRSMTFGTFYHASILAHFIATLLFCWQ